MTFTFSLNSTHLGSEAGSEGERKEGNKVKQLEEELSWDPGKGTESCGVYNKKVLQSEETAGPLERNMAFV